MDNSPVHPPTTRWHKRQWNYGPIEDVESLPRSTDAHERGGSLNRKTKSHGQGRGKEVQELNRNTGGTPPHASKLACTPSGSSHQGTSSCGLGNRWSGHGEGSDSNTDCEQDSDTSKPAYKRGRHEENCPSSLSVETVRGWKRGYRTDSAQLVSDHEAVDLINREGLKFQTPVGVKTRKDNHSVLILVDSQLKFWLNHDNVCKVEFHKNWPISRWNQALKLGIIKVESHTVVLYLEGTRAWQDVPPIKNSLTLLCKTIRNHGNNPRIFIGNHLPRVEPSPVEYPVQHSNFTLQQAIRSTRRALKGGVFELSIGEHFTSCKGKIIKPCDQVFFDSESLTVYGCLIFRECFM